MDGRKAKREHRAALMALMLAIAVAVAACAPLAGARTPVQGKLRIEGSKGSWLAYELVSGHVSDGRISACSTSGLMNAAFWERAGISGSGQDAAEALADLAREDAGGAATARLGRAARDSGAAAKNVSFGEARAGIELESGYWLLVSDSYQPMLVLVGGSPLELRPKSSGPRISKEVKAADGLWASVSELGSGQKASYRIVASLPSNAAAYDELPFEIVDELPSGLQVEKSDVRVIAGQSGSREEDITSSCEIRLSGSLLSIDVGRGNALSALPGGAPAGMQVTVSYEAQLTPAATTGTAGANANVAYARYRPSPTAHGTAETEHVAARVLAWRLRLEKTGGGGALAGAVFELRNQSGETLAEATTGENGSAAFPPIASGAYELVETGAPAGFARAAPTEVVLSADIGAQAAHAELAARAEGAGSVVSCDAGTGVVTLAVEDEPEGGKGSGKARASTAPSGRGAVKTGDGTPFFAVLGLAACAFGVALIMHRVRRRQRDEVPAKAAGRPAAGPADGR